jgi:polar amino acid transport system permease protein
VLSRYIPQLADGLVVTLQVTALGAALTILLSVLVGSARLSPSRPVRVVARIWVEFFRGTSAIVQLFWVFYALPVLGVRLSPLDCGVLALGLNTSAYGAEVVRAVVLALPPSQTDAAVSLHFNAFQRYRYVLAPQALITALPPMGNLMIELLKNSSLVSLVTLADITFKAQSLRAATGHTAELFVMVLIAYFIVALAITIVLRGVERYATRHLRASGPARISLVDRLGRAEVT